MREYCKVCASVFSGNLANIPVKCAYCGEKLDYQKSPIVVVLQPIVQSSSRGVLLIRRSDSGRWAFPSGTIEKEPMYLAATRELLEETCLNVSPKSFRLIAIERALDDSRVILFILGKDFPRIKMPSFTSNEEILERKVAFAPVELAYSLHSKMMRVFFSKEKGGGPG